MFGIDDAALAMMLAGGISTAASLYTNKKNRDAQQEANRISWDIAQQNNATQIEMANTAHQREVRDLRRAHLNPILSAGGSGASTPTLQGASLSPVHTDNAFEGLANSAKGVARYISQQYKNALAQQDADVALTSQERTNLYNENLIREDEHRHDSAVRSAMEGSINAEYLRNKIDEVATQMELGISPSVDRHGRFSVDVNNYGRFRDSVELAREGVRSAMKMKANQNMRAWINSAQSAASSFSSVLNPLNNLFKKGKK